MYPKCLSDLLLPSSFSSPPIHLCNPLPFKAHALNTQSLHPMASFAAARRVASSSAGPRRALTSLASATVPKRLQASPSAEIALSLSAAQVGPALRQRGLSSVSDVAKMDRETILRLLHSLGTRNEVERYLRIFTSSTGGAAGTTSGVLPQAKFAVLKCVFFHLPAAGWLAETVGFMQEGTM